MSEGYDALILGGGPGGSSAGAFLARAGRRVLILEKERFPRFHIGESLLPYNRALFAELGVLPALEAAGFPRKYGAQFHIGNGSRSLWFVFRQGCYTRETEAFQVERAKFDQILLDHARSCGAEVREEHTALRFQTRDRSVAVEVRDAAGRSATVQGSFLIDATGRSNLTANQEGLRRLHPHLKKVAVFGHFENVRLDEGEKRGDTIIVRLRRQWFWLIPVSAERTSVGCVMDQSESAGGKASAVEVFDRLWRSSPPLRERLKDALPVGELHTTADFSYNNTRLIGRRLLRVGDAAGFMDPIFSAGVYLAMHSGKLAAETVHAALSAGDDGQARLRRYERRVRSAMKFYWDLVHHYYTTPFMEVFMTPRENFHLASAMNAALAGELEGGWKLRWRLWLFFWLVKIQARRPIVPRIRFD